MVRGQELPFPKVNLRHPARHGRAVDMHVHRRQKDADLFPLTRGRGLRIRRSRDEHAAVCRRQHEGWVLRRVSIRIAKEIEKKNGEKSEWHGADGADGQSRRNRESGRATDEGVPGAIDRHERGLTLFSPKAMEFSEKRVRPLYLKSM